VVNVCSSHLFGGKTSGNRRVVTLVSKNSLHEGSFAFAVAQCADRLRLPPKIGVPESGSYWRCIGAFRPSLPLPLIAMEPCLLVMQVKRSLSALANVITASQIRTH
jgi:hypothetical protein